MAGAALGASSTTFAWQAQRLVHRAVLLRGRRGTLTVWDVLVRAWSPRGTGCCCVAGAALCASTTTFAWQVQHLVHLALLLRGRRGTLTVWDVLVRAWSPRGTGCFCVAGAALSASSATFAWQVQHFPHMLTSDVN